MAAASEGPSRPKVVSTVINVHRMSAAHTAGRPVVQGDKTESGHAE
jgi:hypothetical protein